MQRERAQTCDRETPASSAELGADMVCATSEILTNLH